MILCMQAKLAAAGEEQRQVAETCGLDVRNEMSSAGECSKQLLQEWYTGAAHSKHSQEEKHRLCRNMRLVRENCHASSDACLISEVLCAI